jgi:phage FluMu protein Com
MISVRCPACGKLMGFEESDAGSLVACPHCRETFFIPEMAKPAAPGAEAEPPPAATRRPLEPTLPDVDDIRIAHDPDLDPAPEKCDEVELAEEPPPAPPPEPEPPPPPPPIMQLELDAPSLPPQPEVVEIVEPVGTPKEVEPTDLAPSLSAAEELSQSLPDKPPDPDRPIDMLDEVGGGDRTDEDVEVVEEEEEEERPRRKSKRREREKRAREDTRKAWTEGLTRNRILGGIGAGMAGTILLGTIAHHLTASRNAWHPGICCGDVFALALLGVGLVFLIRG